MIKDVLRLLDYDIQMLEDQISPTIIEDYGCDVMLTGTHYNANKGNDINSNDKKSNNMQRNESLD
ncbi:MAG: hypothetical protein ACJ703_01635, partial [Nitrososphaera sp.]